MHPVGTRYIFVTGGVCSSLGKGVAAASIGALLEAHDLRVRIIKIDPYINVDAGTMNPYQHGEVYVTEDGAETDLDLGNYARFTSSLINRHNSITTGQVYREVIEGERDGTYLGQTVQVIPHITDRIKEKICAVEQDQVDVVIIEIGGTVGDIESIPFIEAARQMIHERGHDVILSVHVTLLPHISNGEIKTKPTQHSVKELREIGIQPDVLICRSSEFLSEDLARKIASFTNVAFDAVISAPDVEHTIYEIPLIFHRQKLDEKILQRLGLRGSGKPNLALWERKVALCAIDSPVVRIAMVGKYVQHSDSYHSVEEALLHAAMAHEVRLDLMRIDSDGLTDSNVADVFEHVDGMLVPGGFGKRGIEGILRAIGHAREQGLPYFGICMGMQLMAVEFAQQVLGEREAHSSEFVPRCADPVVALMDEQLRITASGGTMRLGKQRADLVSDELREIYASRTGTVEERHRHRYEIVNSWLPRFEEHGLEVAAQYRHLDAPADSDALTEALHWRDHPWGWGVQYHPEFTSKPLGPHPLFASFIGAACTRSGVHASHAMAAARAPVVR